MRRPEASIRLTSYNVEPSATAARTSTTGSGRACPLNRATGEGVRAATIWSATVSFACTRNIDISSYRTVKASRDMHPVDPLRFTGSRIAAKAPPLRSPVHIARHDAQGLLPTASHHDESCQQNHESDRPAKRGQGADPQIPAGRPADHWLTAREACDVNRHCARVSSNPWRGSTTQADIAPELRLSATVEVPRRGRRRSGGAA